MRIELCGEKGSAAGGWGDYGGTFHIDPADAAIRGEAATGSGAANPGGISIEGHRRQIADLLPRCARTAVEDRRTDARNAVALINALLRLSRQRRGPEPVS